MELANCIQAIVTRLGTGEERIPLRRAMRSCLSDFDAMRSRGLTWEQIAVRLIKAGARNKAGRAIAAHNLRTEYARLAAERDGHKMRESVARRDTSGVLHEFGQKLMIKNGAGTIPTRSTSSSSARLGEILKTRAAPLDLDDQ